ncbi:trans-aconitate 2-methyltransferase [Klebsiella sp. BIGb0407]|uniref:class I SAM-dependent methyltransferase n=1 Tax=Klebsiella sp. BIGb0407 TaxID=2940603 RepID=UPI002167D20D|nr:class I SAM-dependent methyltransferase [Klebsiella sp. BIGb0407]MCS3429688.1 trans-aconitate methyltransferase [Klebsiella sp. BIGb0407]
MVKETDAPSAEAIISLYEAQTELWAKVRPAHITLEKVWLDALIANIAPGSRILDIGCGNGVPVAEYFIQREFQLTGLDSSPSMIARCQRRFPDNQWHCADMRFLALGQQFAALVAWDSFFHLTRAAQRQMFPRFAAHAIPGAYLLFNTGPGNGEAIGRFAEQDLYHASLAADEYRYLLQQSGFEVIRHVVEDTESGGRTVWLARKKI